MRSSSTPFRLEGNFRSQGIAVVRRNDPSRVPDDGTRDFSLQHAPQARR